MAIKTETRERVVTDEVHVAYCDLCPAEVGAIEADAMEAIGEREPLYSVTDDKRIRQLYDLCPNCDAYVRDQLDALFAPISRPRRYTGQKPPVPAGDVSASQATQEPSGGDNGAGAEEGAE